MARRKARMPQGKKLQPAPLTMTFGLTPNENFTAKEHYIDLSQCASLINRRFYRQGLNWAVSGFTVGATVTTAGGATSPQGTVSILKIPQNWISSNSWHKSLAVWTRMNNEALEEAESVKPKFLDFKVFADSGHHAAGVDANLIPVAEVPIDPLAVNLGSFVKGEWEYSKVIIPKTDGTDDIHNRELIWTGASYPGAGASGLGAVSMIEGYAASRGLPDVRDPNVPDDAADVAGDVPENWMSATFNDGTDQVDAVLDDMISENNMAPYPFENDGTHTDTMYPGGANNGGGLELHRIQPITSTTIGGLSTMPGGTFYGGLIKVRTAGDLTPGEGSILLQVHLVPGGHRGYMCQPMQDV